MIDSHAHLAYPGSYDKDLPEVLQRMTSANVRGWVEIGTDLEQSRRALALAQRHNNSWATVGVHPSDIPVKPASAARHGAGGVDWDAIEELLAQPKVVAVGEVGFDFYRTPADQKSTAKDQQWKVLTKFVELAKQRDLPMVFHVRDTAGTYDAHETMIEFLQSLPVQQRPSGVIHTFSGTKQHAKEYLELGVHVSFSGVVTFKKAGEIAEVAATMPLDRVLIETDCPFLAPEPHRGQRNEPAYVALVADRVAQLRKISFEEVDQTTEENTRRLFNLRAS